MVPPMQRAITIRPLRSSDADALYTQIAASLSSLTHWLAWCREDYSISDAQEWIRFCQEAWDLGTEFAFGVFNEDGLLIGGAGLTHVQPSVGRAELGYWIGCEHRGKGFARQAAELVCEFGFRDLRLNRIDIAILLNNISSRCVARRLGAAVSQVQPGRIQYLGEGHPAVIYSLWRPE